MCVRRRLHGKWSCLYLLVFLLHLFLTCNLRSGVLFSEKRERKAKRDSAVSQALVRREKSSFFSPFPTADSRVAILSRSSEKRTPDRRLPYLTNCVDAVLPSYIPVLSPNAQQDRIPMLVFDWIECLLILYLILFSFLL